ncbi:MAG: hypothetical protein ACRDNT_17395 [Streptosporangiaceae bacterium]
MPDDLSSIEGLADKHLRALARQQVTDLRGLVQAERGAIYRAMANLRPRPTLEQISRWQDDARSKLGETVPDASEWQMAASFVVVFSQRQVDGTWERRVEAERTEVEPERNPQAWPGWDAQPVCDWMAGQLSQAGSAEEPAEKLVQVPAVPSPTPASPTPASRAPASRAQLRIDSAAIIDTAGQTDVVTVGVLAANPRTDLVAPVRVVFTVGGAPPGTRLLAVTRIQRPDGPGWNPQDPVALPGPGPAEFDLALLPAGDHEMSLIAWTPDATAKPVSVRLPMVTIRPDLPVCP